MARDDERSEPQQERDRRAAAQRARRARGGKLIVALTILVLVMLFAVQNSDPTKLRFLWFEFSPPLIWVIAIVGLAAALAGFIVGRPGKRATARREDREG